MRGTKAKQLRRLAFGADGSHLHRKYVCNPRTGQILATGARRAYQASKKATEGAQS